MYYYEETARILNLEDLPALQDSAACRPLSSPNIEVNRDDIDLNVFCVSEKRENIMELKYNY